MQINPPLALYVIQRSSIYTPRRNDEHPFPPLHVSYVSFFRGGQTDTFLLLPIYETILRGGFTFINKTLKLSWTKDNVYLQCDFLVRSMTVCFLYHQHVSLSTLKVPKVTNINFLLTISVHLERL